MRGTFKSGWRENKDPMKQLGKLMPILLLLGVGIACGLATASQLTAEQYVQPSVAAVEETAMVTIMLSYSGNEALEVMITPGYIPGIVADSGAQTTELYPGSQQMIRYPIRAERSGSYWITSLISYTDEGIVRRLSKESPFTVTGGPSGQPEPPSVVPAPIMPGPIGSNPEGGNLSTPDQVPLPPPDAPAPSANDSGFQQE
jgi:hypothetical protein